MGVVPGAKHRQSWRDPAAAGDAGLQDEVSRAVVDSIGGLLTQTLATAAWWIPVETLLVQYCVASRRSSLAGLPSWLLSWPPDQWLLDAGAPEARQWPRLRSRTWRRTLRIR